MEQFDIKTKYGNLHVYKKGNGPRNIVLLHGSGSDHAMISWKGIMERFTDEFTVYAPDLLGYGRSDRPQDMCGSDFYDKHIGAVKEVTDAFALKKFVLAGLSMGGAIAIGFALRYPGCVELLIPVDSWGVSPKLPLHKLSYWGIYHTDLTLTLYRLVAHVRWIARCFTSCILIGHKETITDEVLDEIIDSCKEDRAGRSMQDFEKSSSTKDGTIPYFIDELETMEMPVVFVTGEKDPLIPVRDIITAAGKTKTNKYYILEGCKHWASKECPAEFVKVVMAWSIHREKN